MTTDPRVAYVRDLISPLCAPLHQVFPRAAERAHDIREAWDINAPEYDYLGTHLTRGLAHRALTGHPDLGGWKPVGNHQRNGELHLGKGTATIRLLHSLDDGDVPPAGTNQARRAFYSNTPLFPIQEEVICVDQLLGVWRVLDWTTYEVGFRIVRPLRPWPYRRMKTVHLDVDFLLPRTADQFEELEFRPADEDLTLTLPDEQEETPDADSLGG